MTTKTKTPKAPKLSSAQQRMMGAINDAGASTDAELAADLNTSPSAARQTAMSLVKKGLLVSVDGRFGVPTSTETETSAETPSEAPSTADQYVSAAQLAIVDAVERQARDSVAAMTKSGSEQKVATVPGGYVTLDGKWAMVKCSENPKTPWVLFSVAVKKNGELRAVVVKGEFASSSKALAEIGPVA